MEHQVFVPVPAEDLRAVLRDPGRVARCVPGLQQDADSRSGPLSGRLKVRVGGHTVTYRGALTVVERDPDHYRVAGEGAEVRGQGTVTFSLALRLSPVDGGTRLDLGAEGAADGRAAAFAPEAAATAVRRLLDRAAEQLGSAAAGARGAEGVPGAPGVGNVPGVGGGAAAAAGPGSGGADRPAAGAAGAGADPDPDPDAGTADESDDSDPVAEGERVEGAEGVGDGAEDVTEVTASVFETEVPAPSLDPFLAGRPEDPEGSPRPPAEAAHARRTMIGRSAEEVDHAPPRGRYAPVPAPAATTAGDNLRWLAPAAALAVASAVVLGRALRRRR
ncbi:SRPBCC domain-containing protein [Streptomyces sp. NPDC058655]|uniref:SRPBCC domain-containing protein n=1 Tax=Streptomyces sp. NPDC058655 TaxID=3346577 RepID=UPI0036630379